MIPVVLAIGDQIVEAYSRIGLVMERRMQPARGRFARFDLDRQIASTFPAHWKVGPAPVFWASQPLEPAEWLALIILKAGDVESNPGPQNRDTIDHSILGHRLHTDFGFTDAVLQWFSSYLTDRTHYISLSNHCSAFAPVHSCVPQGSVLGPILFTMYIKPLSAIIDSHSIIHHSFADDLQLQMSAPPYKIFELLHSMQA